jgi:hypothetical protein
MLFESLQCELLSPGIWSDYQINLLIKQAKQLFLGG